jgi:ABC-2 type transport system permease protein
MRAAFLPASFAARAPAGSAELGRVALVLLLWCAGALVACLLTFRWTSHTDG